MSDLETKSDFIVDDVSDYEYDSESESESDDEEPEMDWVWISGYKNLYAIYPDGMVFSLRSRIFLKPILNGNGYLKINLWKNGKQKMQKIHRLIALHFIANPESKKCVDHMNGIRTDNLFYQIFYVS